MNDARHTSPIAWQAPEAWPQDRRPAGDWCQWLLDVGSLTERLRSRCGERLTLELLFRGYGAPRADEAAALAPDDTGQSLLRRVLLAVDGVPVIQARAVIPPRTLQGTGSRLATLDARPLGEVAFAELDARREGLEVALLPAGSELFPDVPDSVWARRSILVSRAGPVLVTEAFLPALLELAGEDP